MSDHVDLAVRLEDEAWWGDEGSRKAIEEALDAAHARGVAAGREEGREDLEKAKARIALLEAWGEGHLKTCADAQPMFDEIRDLEARLFPDSPLPSPRAHEEQGDE